MTRARIGRIKASVQDVSTTADVDAPKDLGGRPTVKTPENREKILAEVRTGTPKTCAAVYAGIGRSTFQEWENEDPSFVEALEDAEQVYFDSLRKKVEEGRLQSGKGHDWRASFALLERRDRKTYGAKEAAASSVTVHNTANITVVISPEQLANLQERRKAALEGLTSGRN